MATAGKAFRPDGGDNSKTVRKSLNTTGDSITLPPRISAVTFRNAGTNDIRIRINATGANFWTLKPDELSPKILVKGATLDAASVGGVSTLECIFEG